MIIEEYMQYWGKLLGVIVAIWAGAGFWGVVLGLIVGHMIDSARSNKRSRGFFTDQQTRQTLFFRTTFQVMGHLTKSKGRVTEADIQIASLFMDRLQLHGKPVPRRSRRFEKANRASSR
jgi:DnaJ like chaperone protein